MSFLYFLGSVILFFIVSTLTQIIYGNMKASYQIPLWFPILTAILMLLSLTYLGFHWLTVILIGIVTGIAAANSSYTSRYRI